MTCPRCGQPARRETDTMDTFVDSSWYWFRYLSPHKSDGPVDPAMVERWTPVDEYTGGAEHAVMHLLYARFFTKAMADLGLVTEREPFLRLFNQGQILGADGERMSKSRGNVQDPDDLVRRYGADTVRLFLMFMGPWDQGGPWSPTGIGGVHRFLNRVWTLALDPNGREAGNPESGVLAAGETEADARATLRGAVHRTLRDVSADYEAFHFNTMIAKLMELTNTLFRYRGTPVAGSAEWDEAIRLPAADAGPGGPAHHRGAVEPAAGRGRRAMVVDPHPGLAGGRRRRHGRGDPRGPGPDQRQAAGRARRSRPTRRRRRWRRSSSPTRRWSRPWPAGPPIASSTPAASSSTSSSATDGRRRVRRTSRARRSRRRPRRDGTQDRP